MSKLFSIYLDKSSIIKPKSLLIHFWLHSEYIFQRKYMMTVNRKRYDIFEFSNITKLTDQLFTKVKKTPKIIELLINQMQLMHMISAMNWLFISISPSHAISQPEAKNVQLERISLLREPDIIIFDKSQLIWIRSFFGSRS